MHRRARHLNPGHAGANFALDSRFGFSLSDNADVGTWPDRTANAKDATQATTAYKPKYRTNITGGQPAIQFSPTSSNNKSLSGSVTITTSSSTTICVVYPNALTDYGRAATFSKDGNNDYDSSTRFIACLRFQSGANLCSFSAGSDRGRISVTTQTWNHWTSVFTGTNGINRLNESTSATTAVTTSFDVNKYQIGGHLPGNNASTSTQGYWDGYIAHVSSFSSQLSDPLRKRLQFANALSFKIACN